MPIVEIEAVGPAPTGIGQARVQRSADALGQALGVAPGKVWLRVRTLPRGACAENGTEAAATPAPVFVRLRCARLPGADDLEREVAAVTRAVAAGFGRSEPQVHVEVAPPGPGRVAFGGPLSAQRGRPPALPALPALPAVPAVPAVPALSDLSAPAALLPRRPGHR